MTGNGRDILVSGTRIDRDSSERLAYGTSGMTHLVASHQTSNLSPPVGDLTARQTQAVRTQEESVGRRF